MQDVGEYALKADILHYFDTVDHEILIEIIRKKITDIKVIKLIEIIVKNHKTETLGKGMPIGNLTSQFFANVYLHKLDLFVKHELKAKYYIRYVDDFVIIHEDKQILQMWKNEMGVFLKNNLKLDLHPEKSKIIELKRGITILGFRIFYNYRLVKKSNLKRICKRLGKLKSKCDSGEITIDEARNSLEGWLAYASFANSYKLRKRIIARFDALFKP